MASGPGVEEIWRVSWLWITNLSSSDLTTKVLCKYEHGHMKHISRLHAEIFMFWSVTNSLTILLEMNHATLFNVSLNMNILSNYIIGAIDFAIQTRCSIGGQFQQPSMFSWKVAEYRYIFVSAHGSHNPPTHFAISSHNLLQISIEIMSKLFAK